MCQQLGGGDLDIFQLGFLVQNNPGVLMGVICYNVHPVSGLEKVHKAGVLIHEDGHGPHTGLYHIGQRVSVRSGFAQPHQPGAGDLLAGVNVTRQHHANDAFGVCNIVSQKTVIGNGAQGHHFGSDLGVFGNVNGGHHHGGVGCLLGRFEFLQEPVQSKSHQNGGKQGCQLQFFHVISLRSGFCWAD